MDCMDANAVDTIADVSPFKLNSSWVAEVRMTPVPQAAHSMQPCGCHHGCPTCATCVDVPTDDGKTTRKGRTRQTQTGRDTAVDGGGRVTLPRMMGSRERYVIVE